MSSHAWCASVQLGSVAAYLVWVFAGSFEMFVLARILGGSTRALVQLAVAMVADVTPPEGRTKGMVWAPARPKRTRTRRRLMLAGTGTRLRRFAGFGSSGQAAVGVAFSVGFTAGPMLGAFLRSANVAALWPAHLPSPHPFAGVAVAALALGTASAAVVVFALAETLPHVQEHPAAASAPDRSGPTERSRAELDAMVWRVQAINVAYVFVFAGLEFLLAFLTAQRFDYTDRQNGQLLAFIGVASAVVQGGYLRRLGPKTDELRVAISGIGAMVVAHTIFAFANSTATLYVAAVCYAFASATVVSCLNSAVSLMAPPDAVARVLGHMRSGGQLGRTLGPAVFAAVFWGQGATIAYSAGAVCGLVPLLLTIWVRRPWLRHRAALLHSKAA